MNPTSHFSDPSPSPRGSPTPAPAPTYEDDLDWLFAQASKNDLLMAKEEANATSYEVIDSATGLSSGFKLAVRGSRRVKISFKNLRGTKSALDSLADLKLRRDAANFKGKAKASRVAKKKAATPAGLDDEDVKPDPAMEARRDYSLIDFSRDLDCRRCGQANANHLFVEGKQLCDLFREMSFDGNAVASTSGSSSVASFSSIDSSVLDGRNDRQR